MILKLMEGYPDYVGKRQIFAGFGNGPASYNQATNDPLTLSNTRRYIDAVFGGVLTISGTYFVRPQVAAPGERQAWSLAWFVTSTGLEVGNTVNLSAEIVQLGGFCGQY